jgi:acyl-CoA thioester hydrolase
MTSLGAGSCCEAAAEPVGEPLRHHLRVRYAECDMQGHVFNAHYLSYFDQSITELWRAALGGYGAMLERGVDLVVAHARLDFRSGARFDEELALEVSVRRLGRTSVITDHRIRAGGRPVVDGELCHVFVEAATLGKIEIPGWARAALQPWLVRREL